MFCPKCGIENPDNGKFCRSCGANIADVLDVVEGKLSIKNGIVSENDYAELWNEKIKKDMLKSMDIENNFIELYSTGVRNTILGAGFLLGGIFLKQIPPLDGFLWLLMIIPAFCLIASGVRRILKSEEMKKAEKSRPKNIQQEKFFTEQPINALPPDQTEYISPTQSYTTKDLVIPSVTEETTKHLKAKR